ncbi:helix-turn-helix domain-containing protein [Hahella sp. SMD15-11]|uniref:Helix-turn-helix domain-containing protein n=1 Tax=Thermohahella caldifontis TaxID=3142973 RepID=A0AB39UVV0_9GAMM
MDLSLVLVVCPGMLATSHTFALEMFRTAESHARANQRRRAPRLTVWQAGTEAVTTQSGLILTPDAHPDTLDRPDLVLIPSLWRNPLRTLKQHPFWPETLRRWHEAGATLVATGTGSVILAASGLLDGRVATTHWHYFDTFQRLFPAVDLKRDFFITQSGPFYCAASLNALADLTVHLIGNFFGLATARHVERHFSHEIRQPYAQRRFLQGDPHRHTDEVILSVQLRIQERPDYRPTLREAAALAGLTERTFSRRFRQATGITFHDYLTQEKLKLATSLLRDTNLSIGEIGLAVGIQDKGQFSRWLQRHTGTTASQYRISYRKKVFSTS